MRLKFSKLLFFCATLLMCSMIFAAELSAWRGETLFFASKNVNRGETIIDFKPVFLLYLL